MSRSFVKNGLAVLGILAAWATLGTDLVSPQRVYAEALAANANAPFELPAAIAQLAFPEGKALSVTDGKVLSMKDGKLSVELTYARRSKTAVLLPRQAMVMFVTREADLEQKYAENSPAALLEPAKRVLQFTGQIQYSETKAPIVGIAVAISPFAAQKSTDTTCVVEGPIPKIDVDHLRPKAVGIVLFSKLTKLAPLGNVIWVSLDGKGVATPTLR